MVHIGGRFSGLAKGGFLLAWFTVIEMAPKFRIVGKPNAFPDITFYDRDGMGKRLLQAAIIAILSLSLSGFIRAIVTIVIRLGSPSSSC